MEKIMHFPIALTSGLTSLDCCVVAGYFLLLFGLAWWVINKSKNTAKDYFLAGNSLGWFIVGSSIFASNIGSEHLVGLAGSGCTDGVMMAHFELHAWCLLILAWVFMPFYVRSKVFTMPEFLEQRFSPNARWVLSLISLAAYVVTKVAVGIFAGGVVFKVLLPELNFMGMDSFWVGSILVIILTGLYTMLGGMRAVAYTETLQTGILIFGSALVTIYGLSALGKVDGGDGSLAKGWENMRAVCANKEEGRDMMNLWRPMLPEGVEASWAPVIEKNDEGKITKQAWYFKDRSQTSHYPWIGMLFCAPIIGLWYWCTDQYIVQRALSAKSETDARRGSIFAACLKLLPVFIFIIPGMICFALAYHGADGLQSLITEENGVKKAIASESQGAFAMMVCEVLPSGIRGIVVAGLLSALMSSLAGVFNACATLFTMDFYKKFRQNVSEQQLVWVGRAATFAMIIIGLLWIPIIQGKNGLYEYLQSVQGYFSPPILTVFLLGVFWKRMNAKGAMAALTIGFALAVLRLSIDTAATLGVEFTEGSFLWILNTIYFQYYSVLIMIICVTAMIAVSYATAAPDYEKIQGLTFGTTSREERAASRSSWSWVDVLVSVLILLAITAAYLYFTG